MSFHDNVRLDTSQVTGGGGGGGGPGGLVVGGGLGGLGALVVLILSLFFGGGGSDGGVPTGTNAGLDATEVQAAGRQDEDAFSACRTGADANRGVQCRVIGTVNSVQAYWTGELPQYGREWRPTQTVLYSGTTQSACGTASNQVGPFYCPLDQMVYLDASFFGVLEQQFGSSGGPLAQEYVVAHEYGHALQDQLGLLDRAQQDPSGPNSGAVRVELMADCLAGVWAHHASNTRDAQGQAFLEPLTESDIRDALSAAASVGDDRIQEATAGRVSPESWTHGSAEARQRWFLHGHESGDLNQCDTFAVPDVNAGP
ncbi:MAG TPA: neutral zinc metallopeptidase [Dermatophilaceae bacterium]|nr:neutral zinc metallopeptidase [Dermatophilaceae bacterium]